jgi:hypothetical protein
MAECFLGAIIDFSNHWVSANDGSRKALELKHCISYFFPLIQEGCRELVLIVSPLQKFDGNS